MEANQAIFRKPINGNNGEIDIHAICPGCQGLKVVFVGQEQHGFIKYRINALLNFNEFDKAKLPEQLCGSCEKEKNQTIH